MIPCFTYSAYDQAQEAALQLLQEGFVAEIRSDSSNDQESEHEPPSEWTLWVPEDQYLAVRDLLQHSQVATQLGEGNLLANFSKIELLQILAAPHEWNTTTVQQAKALLKEQGGLPTEEQLKALQEAHQQKLPELEPIAISGWIWAYLLLLIGGPICLTFTLTILFERKKLPNGTSYWSTPAKDRKHALILSLCSILYSFLAYWAIVLLDPYAP